MGTNLSAAPPQHYSSALASSRWPRWVRAAQRPARIVLGWAILLGLWTYGASFFESYVLPAPVEVVSAMVGLVADGALAEHFRWSLLKTLAGFVLAVAVGAPMGLLMGKSRFWKSFFHEPVILIANIPAITYAVMALVFFGIGIEGAMFVVALISMPNIAINVAAGVESVDADLVKMSRAFNKGWRDILRHVTIPSIMPFIFNGVRMSFAVAWKVVALTEVFGGSNGVGFMIRRSYQLFLVDHIIAWMFFFVVFMILMERFVLVRLEDRFFSWRKA